MQRVGSRRQRTIKQPVQVSGIGFITGQTAQVRFLSAPENSGIVFRRVDLPGQPEIAAHVTRVTGTERRTTIGQGPVQVCLIEHIMAALAGLRIDNCTVEIDGLEPPGMDGSSLAFTESLLRSGIQPQNAARTIFSVLAPCGIQTGRASITLHPARDQELRATYFLDYGPGAPMPRQCYTSDITPSSFAKEIAPCRTFILESEREYLLSQGIGSRTTPKDLLVFGPTGPIDNSLRFANEAARHKVLDILGDLALLGIELAGHVVACRSGHPLNVALGQDLWTRVQETKVQGIQENRFQEFGVNSFRSRPAFEEGNARRAA